MASGFCFYRIPVCTNMCVSASMCVYFDFFFGSFSSVCLFTFLLSYFVLLFLDAYVFSNKRQKGVDLRWGGPWRKGGRGNHNQSILYKKI